jgi:hypothetical protein
VNCASIAVPSVRGNMSDWTLGLWPFILAASILGSKHLKVERVSQVSYGEEKHAVVFCPVLKIPFFLQFKL